LFIIGCSHSKFPHSLFFFARHKHLQFNVKLNLSVITKYDILLTYFSFHNIFKVFYVFKVGWVKSQKISMTFKIKRNYSHCVCRLVLFSCICQSWFRSERSNDSRMVQSEKNKISPRLKFVRKCFEIVWKSDSSFGMYLLDTQHVSENTQKTKSTFRPNFEFFLNFFWIFFEFFLNFFRIFFSLQHSIFKFLL